MSTAPTATTAKLRSIAALFARHANRTFGGGSATIAVLRGELVGKRGWVTDEQVELAYGLSRFTPGTNLLAFCASIGWTLRRARGALIALVAASLPCSVLAAVLAYAFSGHREFPPAVVSLMRGALGAAVAITVVTAWRFARPHVTASPLRAAILVPAALALTLVASPVQIVLIAAVVGLAWPA